MNMRNKSKVHPFFSSSSSNSDTFPVLNLLPAAILALISILSLEDREVLAYMVTRSLKSTNPAIFPAQDNIKSSKKQSVDAHGHKSPALFDCDCFHCYTSFWFRWDSSPHRELIHQAIEAFEEHFSNGEKLKKSTAVANGKRKKKDKLGRGRRSANVNCDGSGGGVVEFPENRVLVLPESEAAVGEVDSMEASEEVEAVEEDDTAAPAVGLSNHKGLARKVLPDVMGIFSSRLWSLWSPNV